MEAQKTIFKVLFLETQLSKNRNKLLFLLLFFIILSAGIVFATAFTSSISPSAANASTSSQLLNFTVNNIGSVNITQVNITIPVGFNLIGNSNSTTASDNLFSSSSNLVIWSNTTPTGFVVSPLTEYFSIITSIPAAANGTTYDFTVNVLDTSSVINTTNVTLTLLDEVVPQYTSNNTNNTDAGIPTLFGLYWTDNVELSGFIFSTNNSGSWQNDSWTALSGQTSWSNVTKTANSTLGSNIVWRAFANDTSNNWASTTNFAFTTSDNIVPTYSSIHNNVTNYTNISTGRIITFGAKWSDNVNLSHYMNSSSVNATAFTNGTWVAFSANGWSNFTIKYPINAIDGNHTVKIYANDSSGNENMTIIWVWFIVTADYNVFSPGGGSGIIMPLALVKRIKGNFNVTIDSIEAGKTANVSIIKTEDIDFRKIKILTKNEVANIKIRYRKITALPTFITQPTSDGVYSYIEINKENFLDVDIDKVTFEFGVSKQWLTDNSVYNSDILLYRWVENGWTILNTTEIRETATEVTYSADSSGFSYFMIGTTGIVTETCEENWACTDWTQCENTTQIRICTDQNSCGTENNKPEESQDCVVEETVEEDGLVGAEDLGTGGVAAAIIMILVVVAVIVVMLVKQKKINLDFLKGKRKFKYKYKAK